MSESPALRQELRKWEERVIYDVRFKTDTKANLQKLNEILFKSMQHFTLIAANSEPLVYKIGRHFITQGLKNENITFIDGTIVESYAGGDAPEFQKRRQIDEFESTWCSNCAGKWILIPNMTFEISIGLAYYLIGKLRKTGATGIVWFAEGSNNLTEVLALKANELRNFYQFPKADFYRSRKKQLPDDEW